MRLTERFSGILDYFAVNQPVVETELKYEDPYQLLVAVILSAQCTDKRVNLITPEFFKRFPDVETLSKAGVSEIFDSIRSCSYPNNKARHLQGMAKVLLKDFNGIVPDQREDLQSLPGVGRKTANVIMSVAFNKPTMAVDTHVFRVAARLGLTKGAKNPLQAEQQLLENIPAEHIKNAHHWLILHGRYVCQARKPKCLECQLIRWCKYYQNKKNNIYNT